MEPFGEMFLIITESTAYAYPLIITLGKIFLWFTGTHLLGWDCRL